MAIAPFENFDYEGLIDAGFDGANVPKKPIPTPTPTPTPTPKPTPKPTPGFIKDQFGNLRPLDPNFVRNAKNEAKAIASGNITAAELEARGGVNASGYYGDSYGVNSVDGTSLTDEEYADARNSGIGGPIGSSGAAINAALAAKIEFETGSKPKWLAGAIQSAEANGTTWNGPTMDEQLTITPEILAGTAGLDTNLGLGAVGQGIKEVTGSGSSLVAVPQPVDANGNPTVGVDGEPLVGTDGKPLVAAVDAPLTPEQIKTNQERQSIITILTDRFNKYGLGGLAKKIKELAVDGASEATITIGLQNTEEYRMRFSANEDRIKKNLRVLTPAEYINVEDSYRQVLRAYGLKQFDNDAYVKQFISNDMSPTELSTRVQTAVQRIQNADPAVGKTLKDFYGIGQADLVGYILDPAASLQKIERQVASAEIGNAARRQGLEAGVAVSEQLAAQGVSEAEAQKGYSTIADILPTAEKLSSIYGTTLPGYGQTEGEQEVFNSLASAQRKRKGLTAAEIANFSGSSGMARNALTSQTKGQLY